MGSGWTANDVAKHTSFFVGSAVRHRAGPRPVRRDLTGDFLFVMTSQQRRQHNGPTKSDKMSARLLPPWHLLSRVTTLSIPR